ncbi:MULTISPECIES: nuclear transport factor 2 family protein [unclassified Serratia (in: enterobacteria)]|uniref:nuclear transport factor 2 family protein n=1 Tax=unclassified Serratia (in: enterobacteria) TaxID=2647522 RepID=UPI000501DAA6|nr:MULTISPECIES: nuclear transport factor 2 family protein [unclassified Serratia (in: enterobacteria)]KFK95587.1 transcriptional regulator [Serratia sp. Ag2]KFL00399.1 transcriptional regulator [Serratia sp. Ag1]
MNSHEALLERFSQFYLRLDEKRLVDLPEVYHHDVHFVDPVGEHQGLAALEAYFRHSLSNLSYCHFSITNMQQNPQQAYVCWHMTYAHPRLRRGHVLNLEGVSQLRFAEQRIIFQRDYYDLGAMLYEHIPLLGQAVLSIKKRLQA